MFYCLLIPCSSLICERPYLSQITQIIADNPKTTLTARCLSLRPLRYLRKNNMQEDSNYCTKNPQYLPQITQIHADKRQVGEMDLLKQMPRSRWQRQIPHSGDNAAHAVLLFVCDLCAICERITRKRTLSICEGCSFFPFFFIDLPLLFHYMWTAVIVVCFICPTCLYLRKSAPSAGE